MGETSTNSSQLNKNNSIDYLFDQENYGLLRVEENALLLMKLLNITTFERTHDVFQVSYISGDSKKLTILITAEEYQFRLQTTEWTRGSYAPAESSKLWKRVVVKDKSNEEMENKILELVEQGLNKMKAEMVTCRYCKQKFQKEHIIMKNVCHGCASKHLGVVF